MIGGGFNIENPFAEVSDRDIANFMGRLYMNDYYEDDDEDEEEDEEHGAVEKDTNQTPQASTDANSNRAGGQQLQSEP